MIPLIACAGMEDAEAADVLHIPVVSAVQGVDVIVTAKASLQEPAMGGRLHFRQIGEPEYVSQPMVRSGDEFQGKIPAKHVAGMGIEYYIVLYLTDGTTVTSPEYESASLPNVIIILPAQQRWFEVLYPEMNSVIEDKRPQISVAFSSDPAITCDNLQVKLDGADITGKCEITQDFLLYVPSEDLRPGAHVVAIANLDRPEMAGSWQFNIAGTPALWQSLSGAASVAWQWADADSDSPFLMHSQGSSFGFVAQTAGQLLGRSFDAWVNRSTFYRSRSTDFGFGFYGDKIRISAGDLFPSISRLTLDGMPARGGEVDFLPLDRVALHLVAAEGRLFNDDEDEFITGLLNSRFGGFQVSIKPLRDKWKVSALYIHARNYAASDPDMPFSIEKRNDIYSLRTELNLPARFALQGEWARSDHLTRYGEDFASELYKDQGMSASLVKRIRAMTLELFYLNIGDEFLSEVNPFVESGRNGFGFSAKYFHKIGLSMHGEYGRYHSSFSNGPRVRGDYVGAEDDVNTEAKTSVNLSLSGLPSMFAVYYQQRVPYAKYDVRGVSLGSSYKFRKLDFSTNGSHSVTSLWADGTERSSTSASAKVRYEVTTGTALNADYSGFVGTGLKPARASQDISRIQTQASIGVRHRIRKDHLFSVDLKTVKLTDKKNAESNYFERVLLTKYAYSF